MGRTGDVGGEGGAPTGRVRLEGPGSPLFSEEAGGSVWTVGSLTLAQISGSS